MLVHRVQEKTEVGWMVHVQSTRLERSILVSLIQLMSKSQLQFTLTIIKYNLGFV